MLERYRIIYAALGLIALCLSASAQDSSQPALERQPVTQSGQADAGDTNETGGSSEVESPSNLAVSLEKIESAIRDLIAEEDKIERERKQDQEKRDLSAQEDMAFWAKLMFWATAATVGVTLGGLALIWRTLHHTKRAADFTQETITVTREIGEAQTRAYLFIDKAKYKITKTAFFASLDIGNAGQSPANDVSISGTMSLQCIAGFRDHPRLISQLPSSASETICAPIGIGAKITESLHFYKEFNFETEEGFGIDVDGDLFDIFNQIGFDIVIHWKDVFGRPHQITVDLFAQYDATPYNLRKKRSSTGSLIVRTEGNN